ncbi:glycosyltransferase [Nocardioides sp. Bht2]|uniref:glycosyltransferase n=1 Tax=Nocardioides sp. Bht2 TaxID=3392297 RepID=UPI0039B411C0
MTVTSLLVSHDGARWLPAVLAGLRDQQRPPDRTLAVDTGSSDESTELLVAEFGLDQVRQVRGGFPQAVRQLLTEIDTEWVWILHDDSAPAPGALAALLDAAERERADVVGAKLREWPDLKRLLEVGVTISASARRETGLERGEYDQGQHDTVREVLAVNTAGMLVRRSLLERLDGFDDELPVFAGDVDFGWRAARVGARTVVAPDAVVFHAEASHRDLRAPTRSAHRREREALMFTVLANSRGPVGAWRWLRLLLSSLLRSLGLLLARSPRAALDELAAIAAVHGRPGRLRRARAARRGLGDGDVALAPWWLPLRHGLDFVSDVGSAALAHGRDVGERRRAESTGSEHDDEDGPDDDSGLVVRLLTSPLALAVIATVVAMIVAARMAFGPLEGGALSPTPPSAGYWWDLLGSGWHPLGQGTEAPAPSYLIGFALLGSLLLGSATAAISLLFLLGAPLAAWGAWRFVARVAALSSGRAPSPWLAAGAALAWAMVPIASGAWGQGRFGVVAAAVVLPWLAGAALGFLDSEPDRRRRAGWRTGLLLALVTAFTPGAWVLAVVVVAAVFGILAAIAPTLLRTRSVWGPLLVVLAVPPVILLPGAVGMLGHDLGGVLLEAGRSMPGPDGADLLFGRLPGPSAPVWLGALLVLAAVAALIPAASRIAVIACWSVVATTAVLAAAFSRLEVELPSGVTGPGLSFGLLMIHGALITAVVIAVHAVLVPAPAGARGSRGATLPRRLVAGGVGAALAVVPVGALAWWLFSADDLLARPGSSPVPAYMRQAGDEDPNRGVLVVAGSVAEGLDWTVQRGDGPWLGEDEILALTEVDTALEQQVTALLTSPTEQVTTALPGRGVEYIVLPAPADPGLVGLLDSATGLSRASTSDRATPAWQFETPVADDAVTGEGPWWFGWLLGVQVIALLAVLILCGPTRREQR